MRARLPGVGYRSVPSFTRLVCRGRNWIVNSGRNTESYKPVAERRERAEGVIMEWDDNTSGLRMEGEGLGEDGV